MRYLLILLLHFILYPTPTLYSLPYSYTLSHHPSPTPLSLYPTPTLYLFILRSYALSHHSTPTPLSLYPTPTPLSLYSTPTLYLLHYHLEV